MTGRRSRAALVFLLALVLAGCGGLSRGGPVEPGLDVASGNPPGLRVLFPGPAAGVDQVSIVRGFVRAGSASDGAYDNARAFLAARTSEKWNPDHTLVLLAGDVAPKATRLDPATVPAARAVMRTVAGSSRVALGATSSASRTRVRSGFHFSLVCALRKARALS